MCTSCVSSHCGVAAVSLRTRTRVTVVNSVPLDSAASGVICHGRHGTPSRRKFRGMRSVLSTLPCLHARSALVVARKRFPPCVFLACLSQWHGCKMLSCSHRLCSLYPLNRITKCIQMLFAAPCESFVHSCEFKAFLPDSLPFCCPCFPSRTLRSGIAASQWLCVTFCALLLWWSALCWLPRALEHAL